MLSLWAVQRVELQRVELLLSEYFGGECFDRRALLPGIRRESRFTAGLFEKLYAVPVVFYGNLRQKQAAVPSHRDQEAVAADLDGFGGDWLWRREDAEFDLQVTSFRQGHGIKARVFESRGARRVRDCAVYGAYGKHIADSSSQLGAQIERGKDAAWLGEMGCGRIERKVALLEPRILVHRIL